MLKINNHNLNIAFPAVIVNTDKIKDNLVDVQPLVRYNNPLVSDTVDYPVIKDVTLINPSNKTSTICFPVSQGDYVDLLVQSVDIKNFVGGNGEVHDPEFYQHGDLSNVVAIIGFSPYQESCFNPENYRNDFDHLDLNIVHNKNTANECSVTLKKDGEVGLKSPIRVSIDSPEVDVKSDKVNFNNSSVYVGNDIQIKGLSLYDFMTRHTHIDGQGSTTSTPTIT